MSVMRWVWRELEFPVASGLGRGEAATGAAAIDLRNLVRGFGFLLIVAGIVGYAVGALQLRESSYGELTVKTTPPGATIFVDGMHRGASPLHVSGLRPGTHQLRALMPGYKGVVLKVEVLASGRDSVDWMLEPSVPATLYRQLALLLGPESAFWFGAAFTS
jgi:hypothetical protein